MPRTYATANWTLPSHASMFTGLLPRALGLEGAARPRDAMLRYTHRMLPEVLRRSGYSTAGVSANVLISPAYGFDAGFDRFEVVVGSRRHRAGAGLRSRLRWQIDAVQARIDDGLAAADRVVRGWLDQGPSQPFFWFVNLMECHSPYLPPKPWNDLRLLGRYRAGVDARRYQSHEGFLRACLREVEVPERSLERMRHLYGRAVASMDDWLGRMLGTLDERGILDDTVVIVTSDHGENLGENHMLGHAISIDDRLIRVPLVAAGPGDLRPAGPHEAGNATSLLELPRMIAEAVGLADHPWHEAGVPAGVAVAQSDGFATLAPAAAQLIVETWRLWPRAQEELFLRRTAVTDGRFKLVREGGLTRLHDLADDPLERADAGDSHPAEAARLGLVLETADTGEERPPAAAIGRAQQHDQIGTSDDGERAGVVDDRADLEERLKLLGYL